MAQYTTTYGDIDQRTAAWAATKMLRHAEPVTILGKFGQIVSLPRNKAATVIFRRAKVYGALTTPLVEGVTPTAQKYSYEDVSATVKEYGGFFELTKFVMDFAEDPVMANMIKSAGEQAAYTAEAVTYGVLKAGTNVFYANGAARASVNTPISLTKQKAVTRALAAQKAVMKTGVLDGSPKFATKPIEPAFIAVGHTDLDADIRALPNFVPAAQYGTRSLISPMEIGSVENVRYVLSPDLGAIADAGGALGGSGSNMLSTSGVNADVYPILYFGEDAFGVVALKGEDAVTPMVVQPKPTQGDPLGQRGSVGWLIRHVAVILNNLWMARLEVAVSAL